MNEGLSGLLSRGKPLSKFWQLIKMVTRNKLLPELRFRQHPDTTGSDASHLPLGLLKRDISYVSPTSDKSATERLKDMACLRVSIGKKTQGVFFLPVL